MNNTEHNVTPLMKSNRWALSQEQLAKVLMVLFLVSLIPLIAIAFYNYPADDDFPYTVDASVAWVQTHSLGAVVNAIIGKMIRSYQNSFGLFMHPIYNATNALIFSIDLYFLNNWYVLAMVCLSIGYLLKGVVRGLLNASRSTFWIVYTAIMILVIQFMPCIGEGVFWHAGSNHTFSAMMLFVLLGLLARCHFEQSRIRKVWRIFCITFTCACAGAVEYSTLLGGTVLLVLLAVWAFKAKSPSMKYWIYTLCVMAVVIVIFSLSPGNAVRQSAVGEPMNPVSAIVVSVLDSFDLAGGWLSPQLFAMLMLIVPVMWKPLKESRFQFSHPLLMFITCYGLYSAALVPGVFSNYGYGAGRYMNVLYFYFLFMIIGSVLYFEGSFIRWLEKQEGALAKEFAKANFTRFSALYLVLCVFFLAMGGFAHTIMNTSSLSAAKSLLNGEAAHFRAEMEERAEYIRITDSDETAVEPIVIRPYVFKDDKLAWQGIYGRIRYQKYYYETHYAAQQKQE